MTDLQVLAIMATILRKSGLPGYSVSRADAAAEALEMWDATSQAIDDDQHAKAKAKAEVRE